VFHNELVTVSKTCVRGIREIDGIINEGFAIRVSSGPSEIRHSSKGRKTRSILTVGGALKPRYEDDRGRPEAALRR